MDRIEITENNKLMNNIFDENIANHTNDKILESSTLNDGFQITKIVTIDNKLHGLQSDEVSTSMDDNQATAPPNISNGNNLMEVDENVIRDPMDFDVQIITPINATPASTDARNENVFSNTIIEINGKNIF